MLLPWALGAFFLFLDQALKYFFYQNPDFFVGWRFLGLSYLENTGIAFSIPFSQSFLLVLTPLFLVLFFFWFEKQKQRNFFFVSSFSLLIFGAISNYIDRFLFAFTIDYINIFTLVINIADIMIVLGAFGLFFSFSHTKNLTRK